jgi:hypothetical protein
MRRAYAVTIAVAAVCVFATAGCDRRGGVPERDPAPNPVVETTNQPAPEVPQEPAAVVNQTSPELDSVDQVLTEVERDLASVDAPPPDAD